MQRNEQVAGAEARLLALLQLADSRAGGFVNERQVSLDKAFTMTREAGMAIENIIKAHRLDISDLRRPASRPIVACGHEADDHPVPPSREHCAGRYPIAGFRHYEGPANRHRMRVGDPVRLLRVIGNPHDRFAVFVTWNGRDLGHLPRDRNAAVWAYLATRSPLGARISGIWAGPHGTVEIEIR